MDKKLESKMRNNFEDALKRLDFVKAGTIMDYLNWCWVGDNYPPTYERIREMINKLFESAMESFKGELISCNSGGFSVTIFKEGKVKIQFVPVESYSYD